MSLPANVSFFMQRLQGVSTSHFKIHPQSSDSAVASRILRFELPSNALLNFDSIRLFFSASADKTAACGGRLPNKIDSLIERVAVYMGGVLVQNSFQSYNLLRHAKDALQGDKTCACQGHPEIVRGVSYHNGDEFKTTENEHYDKDGDQFCVDFWEGLIGSIQPSIVDSGILPQITIEITLAEDSVCSSCKGPGLGDNTYLSKIENDQTGGLLTSTNGTGQASFVLTNISMQVEVLGMSTSVLDEITEARIASVGYISLPFKNYFTYVSSHQGTSRFSVNSASWDRVWMCYREQTTVGAETRTYSSRSGARVVPGHKVGGGYLSLTSGGDVTTDFGLPSYDAFNSNSEKYISNYFRMSEPLTSTSTPASYQLQVNGASVPAFKCNRSEMLAISKNSVDYYDKANKMTMHQYRDCYFVQCMRFCLPDSENSRLASGLDTRSVSAQAALETTGLNTCNLTIFAECTSELRVGAGRAIECIV
jgi:hypothetical protein